VKLVSGHLGIFAIMFFLGSFRPQYFVETYDRSWCTCCKNIICFLSILLDIFPMEVRVLECS
jgi:hypothetical protein